MDIVQAFAYGRSGNVNTPTRLDTVTQAKLQQQAKEYEANYMNKLEQGRINSQQAFAASQQGTNLAFQGSQQEKAQAFDAAKQQAQLEWEQKNGDLNRANAKDIAEISGRAMSLYYKDAMQRQKNAELLAKQGPDMTKYAGSGGWTPVGPGGAPAASAWTPVGPNASPAAGAAPQQKDKYVSSEY